MALYQRVVNSFFLYNISLTWYIYNDNSSISQGNLWENPISNDSLQ